MIDDDAITRLHPWLKDIPALKKISVEISNNSGVQQQVNVLQALITPIANQYPSVEITSNGLPGNYDSLVQGLVWNPMKPFFIYLKTSSNAQVFNAVEFGQSDATGPLFINNVYPQDYVSAYQSQSKYSLIPVSDFVFTGNDYIQDYAINAGESLTMIFYGVQFKRSWMLSPDNLKRKMPFKR